MEVVSRDAMLDCITRGFNAAFDQTSAIVQAQGDQAATHLSSKFVYEVATAIKCRLFPDQSLHVVQVDGSGHKSPGEWLVDALVSEDVCEPNPHSQSHYVQFIDRIAFAMESESNTGTREFNDDFGKLIHLDASVKLYLNGLNQRRNSDAEKYIETRRKFAESIVKRTRSSGQWFLGFWPSPGKFAGTTKTSAWECLPPHLAAIRLFEFRGSFIPVHGGEVA